MTEFKKGDRVRVEFEGEVTWVGVGDNPWLDVDGKTVSKTDVALLERPVEPLARGSVVRSNLGDTWVVSTGGKVHYVGHYGAHESEETPESLAKRLRDQPSEFTLIHDGSKK